MVRFSKKILRQTNRNVKLFFEELEERLNPGRIDMDVPLRVEGPGMNNGGLYQVVANGHANLNNDNVKNKDNFISQDIQFGALGQIDIEFTVRNTQGVSEYWFEGRIQNSSINVQDVWTGFYIEIGFGTGNNFIPAMQNGSLDMDFPHRDPTPKVEGDAANNEFKNLTHAFDHLRWSNGFQNPTQVYTYFYHIDIPDNGGAQAPENFLIRDPITNAPTGYMLTTRLRPVPPPGGGGGGQGQAPVANDDLYSVVHDQTLTTYASQPQYGVLFNDWDDDGDPITVTAVNGDEAVIGDTIGTNSGATLTVNSDGSFQYTPAAGYVGQDNFTYTVSDGVNTSTATVYIDVTNQLPYAVDDGYSVVHDQTLATSVNGPNYPVTQNDMDYDGDSFTVTAITASDGTVGAVGTAFTLPSGATVTMQADGNYTYTPPALWTGQDSFTYTISDGIGSATATVTIHVTNQMPIANTDLYSTGQGQPLTITTLDGLLSNDDDPDGDSIWVAKVNGSSANVGTQIMTAAGGTLTVNADGSFTYEPPIGFTGTDSFTYEVTDGLENSLATVYLDVF